MDRKYFFIYDTEFNARWAYGDVNDRMKDICRYLIKNTCKPEIFRIVFISSDMEATETLSLQDYVEAEL